VSPRAAGDRPNVLLVMLDQMRWDAIAHHGNGAVRTPAMDALCRRGTTFSRAYTPSPVCVPSRAALLTGLLPHRSGVVSNATPLAEGTDTVAHAMRRAGYDTCAIGKMHFTPVRADHGFDRMLLSEEIPDRVEDDDYLQDLVAAGFGHVEEPHGVRHELYYTPQPSQLPEQHHTTAWTGRRTVEFLEQRAARDPAEPFFCFTSFIKPHPPFDPPSPWHRMYDPLDMPDPVRELGELDALSYQQRIQHRVKWMPPDADLLRLRTMRAYYYACVSFVDAWLGRISETLERTGLAENTVVVLTSDHGEYLGDHWSFGKRGFHEVTAGIPLVVAGPGVRAGVCSDALVMLPDVTATLADAAGAELAVRPDGESLLPLLAGERTTHHDWLSGQLGEGAPALYMATDDRWKYVYGAADQREWLFDLADARETVDLSAEPAAAAELQRLRGLLVERLRADGYDDPFDGDRWRRLPARDGEPELADRDPAGRGRQYAVWPAGRTPDSALAAAYVPAHPPASRGEYRGA
jgi:arylsulfatase